METIEIFKGWLDKQEKKELYVQVMSVAKSGMSRRVKVYLVLNNRIMHVTRHVSKVIDYTLLNDNTIRIGGCGYNIADWLVKRVSKELYENENLIDYNTL
jgi:hypothetical protein